MWFSTKFVFEQNKASSDVRIQERTTCPFFWPYFMTYDTS